MKVIELRRAGPVLTRLVAASKKDHVVFTREGKPVAVLETLSPDDLEDWDLEHDPVLIARSEESRRQHQQGRSKTLEAVRAERLRKSPPSKRK